ncbi:MAG: M48 family metalloprotease [Gammaproteobacteria bacterium]|nr:M48 family metalloprotease [Gammaproteobacteria bacterium]
MSRPPRYSFKVSPLAWATDRIRGGPNKKTVIMHKKSPTGIFRKPACLALLAAMAGLILSSCASNPTGGSDFVLMSEEDELQLGARLHPQIIRQFGIYQDQRLQNYVNDIGQKLAAVSHRPNIKYRFTVLDDDQVNAFATPGGYIYITRGIMAYLDSEAELAAIVGHEIAHVTARHAVRQHGKSSIVKALSAVAGMLTPMQSGSVLTSYVGGALLSGFGRKAELQADGLGAEYMAKAGYDPESIIDVLRVMKQKEMFEVERARQEGREAQVYHGVFATHPDNDTRLKEVVGAADKLQVRPDAVVNAEAYLSRINGLVFGESRGNRVIRAHKFYDRGLGIKVTFPEGWAISNRNDEVIATSPDGNAALFFSALPIPKRVVPKTILRQQMGARNIRDSSNITIDGLPSFLAIADYSESAYGKRPVRYAFIADPKRRVGFIFAGAGRNDRRKIAADPEFIKAIFSFDRMNDADFRAARLPVISLHRADGKSSFASLAENSVIGLHAEDQLRLLNRAYPDGEPVAGKIIKEVR